MTTNKYGNESNNGSTAYSGAMYFLIGGGIGAAIALLFAPKAGVDLRRDISDMTRKGYDETLDLAHRLQEQSAELYQTIKERSERVYTLAADKLSLARDSIGDGRDAIGKEIESGLHQVKDEVYDKKVGLGSKSNSVF